MCVCRYQCWTWCCQQLCKVLPPHMYPHHHHLLDLLEGGVAPWGPASKKKIWLDSFRNQQLFGRSWFDVSIRQMNLQVDCSDHFRTFQRVTQYWSIYIRVYREFQGSIITCGADFYLVSKTYFLSCSLAVVLSIIITFFTLFLHWLMLGVCVFIQKTVIPCY